jgi:hypothetical protein
MSLNVKVLGQGTIGDSAASDYELLTLYSSSTTPHAVPSGKAIIVKAIRLVSTGTRSATLNYLSGIQGSANRAVSPKNLILPANALVVLDDELTMVAGDKLRTTIDGATGTSVDFVISGVERDQ